MEAVKLEQYREHWRKRSQAGLTPEMQAAREEAQREAERLGRILAEEFQAKRVYLFGSFVWGITPRPDSDIDLAVEGLPPGKLVFAHARLSTVSPREIDLVVLERAPETLRKRILLSGKLVYDDKRPRAAG